MRFRPTAALGCLAILISMLSLTTPATVAAPAAADEPERSLSVAGAGVSTYPVFDPATTRYAVVGAEDAVVQLRATTSDPTGRVLVDGVPHGTAADVTVSGEPGDEVSVIFDDGGGRTAYSLFLLPAGFPTLEAWTEADAELDPGLVLLTLSSYTDGASFLETAVDRNGVPTYVHKEASGSLDLKRQPNGQLTVQRASAGDGFLSGSPVVVLDDDWRPTGETHETANLINTDPHDSILRADGHVILMSYEPRDSANGRVQDAVVQELDDAGAVVHTWRTGDAEVTGDSIVPDNPDYAHINSVVVMEDGSWLLSFRHFSSVWKVDPETGAVIWKLGGRRSDFTFTDDPDAGPCAQHTASELPNGSILIYDNGGGQLFTNPTLCVDPANPESGRVDRPYTRISEYALDESSMEATLVNDYRPEPHLVGNQPKAHFAYFAGGVSQSPTGHRLIGWASTRVDIATELDADGQTPLWTLRDTNPVQNDRQFSYRAHLAQIDDAIAPSVSVDDPEPLLEGSTARLDWQCRDRGGSGLADCTVPGSGVLDTSIPGTHEVTVTATDAAGNTTVETATYVVKPVGNAVDAMIRAGGGAWQGKDIVAKAKKQQAVSKLNKRKRKRTAKVRITNRGSFPEQFIVTGKGSSKAVKVVYRSGGRRITNQITKAGFRTSTLTPGESVTVKMKLKRKRAVKRNQAFPVQVQSASDGSARDAVRMKVKVRK